MSLQAPCFVSLRPAPIVVTDRGKPVARIVSADGRSKLDELIAAGLVERAPRRTAWLPKKRAQARGSVGELVKEQRR